MVIALGTFIILALIFGPSLWVKLVMWRYSSEKPEMPGTGGELAKHLVERFSLKDVGVEVTEQGEIIMIQLKKKLGFHKSIMNLNH